LVFLLLYDIPNNLRLAKIFIGKLAILPVPTMFIRVIMLLIRGAHQGGVRLRVGLADEIVLRLPCFAPLRVYVALTVSSLMLQAKFRQHTDMERPPEDDFRIVIIPVLKCALSM
jgi:hypothetical protein